MRILLVDDGDEKFGVILGALGGLGFSSEDYDVANCISDAKRRLKREVYAMVVIDMNISISPSGPKELTEVVPGNGARVLLMN